VVESQAVAQRERPLHPVAADRVLVDHLRPWLEIRVVREQRVVHHVAVVARDVCGRPDWVEDLEVADRHEPQRAALFRRLGRGGHLRRAAQRRCHRGCGRGGAGQERTAIHAEPPLGNRIGNGTSGYFSTSCRHARCPIASARATISASSSVSTLRSRISQRPSTMTASMSAGWPLCTNAETILTAGTRLGRRVSTTKRSAFLPTSRLPAIWPCPRAWAPLRAAHSSTSSG